jgi:hypothetical protein
VATPTAARDYLLVAVGLFAASFAGLSVTGGHVAYASDDWTTGHSGERSCANYRVAEAVRNGALIWTQISWTGYDVSVRGYALDNNLIGEGDGYCARNRIRYKVDTSGTAWSGWQYRWIATACGAQTDKLSTWWWSRYPTTQLQAQACLSDGSDSPTLGWSCTDWR